MRLCGYRVYGGIYWESRGELRSFLHDPPIPVDPAALGVSPIGVTSLSREGVVHLLDWVGETHYPSVEAFLLEASVQGISRRMPRTMNFGAITENSRLLLIHPHACGPDQPGVFASVPLTRFAVIRDARENLHREASEILERAGAAYRLESA
jgi:hypothetical protein